MFGVMSLKYLIANFFCELMFSPSISASIDIEIRLHFSFNEFISTQHT